MKLTELIEQFEKGKQYEPAGGYGGLVPSYYNFGDFGAYLMGQSPREHVSEHGYYLLGCSCGEVGCWPLEADIAQSSGVVVWSEFRQPFRPERDYSSFGPFVFDFNAYSRAISELLVALSPDR